MTETPAREAADLSLGFVVDVTCDACGYQLLGRSNHKAAFCPGCADPLVAAAAASTLAASATPAVKTAGPPQVLVVEDTTSLRRLIVSIVRDFGNEPVEAHSGRQALKFMAATVPDLVITDFHMPEMTGIQLLQKMRQDPRLQHVKVVMLSRESSAALIRQAKALKVLDFIHKDDFYDPEDLRIRLARFLHVPKS